MAQPVTAILARQGELAEKAREFTGDANEAGLLVGRVMGRAFDEFHDSVPEDVLARAMRRELDRMIEQLRISARA